MSKLSSILVPVLADLEQHVEAKVKAATTAATATGFLVTLIGSLAVFHGGAVPTVITSLVGAVVTGGLTFAAGFLAKHTPRTPPPVPAAPVTAAPVAAPSVPPAA